MEEIVVEGKWGSGRLLLRYPNKDLTSKTGKIIPINTIIKKLVNKLKTEDFIVAFPNDRDDYGNYKWDLIKIQ